MILSSLILFQINIRITFCRSEIQNLQGEYSLRQQDTIGMLALFYHVIVMIIGIVLHSVSEKQYKFNKSTGVSIFYVIGLLDILIFLCVNPFYGCGWGCLMCWILSSMLLHAIGLLISLDLKSWFIAPLLKCFPLPFFIFYWVFCKSGSESGTGN